ncbi:hypothetical protein HPB50_020669 [Hyalomma asiaticum]|uniref:Uncharacterized protein n=1 Tax=Hyalomma asiaticum TaxID=266040 RepID=A0ACB7SJJ4_HYAAI|nr:hypothetical protein HPB50_020669 [Hyalomma asiaticum]
MEESPFPRHPGAIDAVAGRVDPVHVVVALPADEACQDPGEVEVALPDAMQMDVFKTRPSRVPSSTNLTKGISPLRASSSRTTLGSQRSADASKCSGHSSSSKLKKKSWQPPPSKRSLDAMRDFSPCSSFGSPMSSSIGGAMSPGMPSSSRTPTPMSPWTTLPQSVKASIAVVLVIIVTITATLIWLLASTESRKAASEGCRSQECEQYAKRLRESLNESVHPCTDFTRYVCDGWRRTHVFSVAEEAFMSTFDGMSRFVRTIEIPASGQTPVQRAAAFYRSCIKVLRGERNEMPRVRLALAAAGITWPDEPNAAPDLLHTLIYVHLRLHWGVLFNVDVISNKNESSIKVGLIPSMEMAPIKKRLELIRAPEKAREYFNTLVSAFGAHAKQGRHRVTFTETNVTETIVLGALFTGLLSGSPNPQVLNATSLFAMVPNLTESRWRATLRSMGIAKRVFIETTYPTYVTQFLALWKNLGESRLHLFLSWYTIQTAALYTNKLLVENFYGSEKTALLRHGAFCFSKAYLLSGTAVFRSSVSYTLDGAARTKAVDLLWSVRDAFSRSLQSWPYDNASVAKALDFSKQEFTATSFALFSENNVTELDRSHDSDTSPSWFADSWIAAAVPYRADISRVASMAIERLSFTAVMTDGRVVLMPYAFSFPFFDVRGASAMNYAGVGFHFANALSHLALVPYAADLDGPLYRFYKCIGVSFDTVSPERLLGAFSAFAVQPLYEAFNNASSKWETENILPELPYLSGPRLFFVSLCYAKCHGSWTGGLSEPECRDFLPHLEAFSKAFDCPVGSPMNRSKKCDFL